MEAFGLAVGLGAVRPVLHGDAELGAGVAPQAGLVGGAVVGQTRSTITPYGEPVNGPAQDGDRARSGLVVVALGVGQPDVVVDQGVHEKRPDFGVVLAGLDPGAVASGVAVVVTLGLADEAPASPAGMLPNLVVSTWSSCPAASVRIGVLVHR